MFVVLLVVFAVAAGVIYAVPPVRERALPLNGVETPSSSDDAGYIRIRVTPADNDCGYAITGYERQYNGSIDRTNGQRIAE